MFKAQMLVIQYWSVSVRFLACLVRVEHRYPKVHEEVFQRALARTYKLIELPFQVIIRDVT